MSESRRRELSAVEAQIGGDCESGGGWLGCREGLQRDRAGRLQQTEAPWKPSLSLPSMYNCPMMAFVWRQRDELWPSRPDSSCSCGVVVEVPRYMPISVCASSARRPKAIESASEAGMRRVTRRERRVTDGHVWETAAREAAFPLDWLALTGWQRGGVPYGSPYQTRHPPMSSEQHVAVGRV